MIKVRQVEDLERIYKAFGGKSCVLTMEYDEIFDDYKITVQTVVNKDEMEKARKRLVVE